MGAKNCGICGEPLVMFKKHKTADGHICHVCFTAAGFNTGMVCFADTTERIKGLIHSRNASGETRSYREQYVDAKAAKAADPIPKCPKCGAASITANQKGFGIGKAVVGAAVAGPVGLVAGNLGAKKVRITCLKCGHQWMAGKA